MEIESVIADRLRRISEVFLLSFGALALALAYWGIVRAPGLLARDDNPRLVEAELRVQRSRILDHTGAVMAETIGEPGTLVRRYPAPYSPAVGYYSLRYGVAGIEQAYDSVLRGRPDTYWDGWLAAQLHWPPVGSDVELTLDARVQATAEAALGEQVGAVVVLDARSGDILAMVSHPTFDPNRLDEQFEELDQDTRAPLVNRAVQGQYQPGTMLQPLLLGLALDAGLATPDDPVSDATAPVQAGDVWVTCLAVPPAADPTLATALAYGCPGPFAGLAERLGIQRFWDGMTAAGMFDPVGLPLASALDTRPVSADSAGGLVAEVSGQGEMTVSPLQMAWAMTAIAADGQRPALRLVRRIGKAGGGWELVVPAGEALNEAISPQAAALVAQAMVAAAQSGAVSVTSPGVVFAAHTGRAVAGPAGALNSWFVGFAPADGTSLAARPLVVVLLEGSADVQSAAAIGRDVLLASVSLDN